MTEMVRVLADSLEPRQVGTRAFDRAISEVEVRVVDDQDLRVTNGPRGNIYRPAAYPLKAYG
jgi:hypothetical protein